MTRLLLFTGKGGVGKTSVAAASSLRAAQSGLRTLVMSTDPAHSLADAFDMPLGSDPTPVTERLAAEQLEAHRRLEDHWGEVQAYLAALLRWGGVGEVEAEELSLIPGLEEIFSLVDVQRHVDAGTYDLVVVDCAPTAETLRLLSLPDALGWYIERIFPVERKVAKVVRPVLGRMTSMPLPADSMLGSVERLYGTLAGVREILQDGKIMSVRLVVNAEKMVIAEARRTYTYLNLFGYHVDAVVVNRLIPDEVSDPWFDRWKALQATHLASVHEGFGDLPVLSAPLFDEELVGVPALHRLGEAVYGEREVHDILYHGEPLRFSRVGDHYELVLSLPFVGKGEVDVLQRGEELYIKVGAYTRNILLPGLLVRREVAGASLSEGSLVVRFAADDDAPVAGAQG